MFILLKTRLKHDSLTPSMQYKSLATNSRNRYENIQHHSGTWCTLTAHALRQQRSSTTHTLAQATRQHSTDVNFFAVRIDPSAVMRPGGQSSHWPATRELDQSVDDVFDMIYNKGTFAKWQISSVTEKHLF
jgi:hypothetical protein